MDPYSTFKIKLRTTSPWCRKDAGPYKISKWLREEPNVGAKEL
jgi:hypothetical protein